jgi:hypothetical protein
VRGGSDWLARAQGTLAGYRREHSVRLAGFLSSRHRFIERCNLRTLGKLTSKRRYVACRPATRPLALPIGVRTRAGTALTEDERWNVVVQIAHGRRQPPIDQP